MQILFLTLAGIDDGSYGGAIRSTHIRNALQQVGDVHTLVIHGASDANLDQAWSERWVKRATYNRFGQSPAAWRQRAQIRAWVAGILKERHYDVIVARYLGLALFVPRPAWSRLVVDADDILKSPPAGGGLQLKLRAGLWARNLIARRALKDAAHVWVVNPLDAPRLGVSRISWLSNVIRMPDASRPKPQPVPGRILMVGYLEHPPNAQALRWFADEVLPALAQKFPGVELHAIGKHAPGFEAAFSGGHVRIRGFVDDIVREYDLASLVIAPIESGGGTQIKVIDALAHSRPLVASSFAHAGFAKDLLHREHLLVCQNTADWLTHCTWVLNDRAGAESMGARGHVAVRPYGTEGLTSTIHSTLASVVRKPA